MIIIIIIIEVCYSGATLSNLNKENTLMSKTGKSQGLIYKPHKLIRSICPPLTQLLLPKRLELSQNDWKLNMVPKKIRQIEPILVLELANHLYQCCDMVLYLLINQQPNQG